jgi:hypothetical protein
LAPFFNAFLRVLLSNDGSIFVQCRFLELSWIQKGQMLPLSGRLSTFQPTAARPGHAVDNGPAPQRSEHLGISNPDKFIGGFPPPVIGKVLQKSAQPHNIPRYLQPMSKHRNCDTLNHSCVDVKLCITYSNSALFAII